MSTLLQSPRLSASFSPTDLTGLVLWLKADGTLWQDSARTTPATADGDPVGCWDDASGQANHVKQATSTKRPLLKLAIQNGKNVLRWDGVDDRLISAILGAAMTQPLTVFAVAKPNAANALGNILDGASAGHRVILGQTSGSAWRGFAGGTVAGGTVTAAFHQLSFVLNGVSSVLRVDGAQVAAGDAGAAAYDGFLVGDDVFAGNQLWVGDVSEIFIYQGDKTASLAQAELYAKTRWGTP